MKEVVIGSYVMKEDVLALGADNWGKFRDWLKENTKLRVNNGLGNYSGGVMYESNHAVHLDYSGLLVWCGEEHMEECKHQLTAKDILQLINQKEEKNMFKPEDEVTITTTYGELAKVYAIFGKSNGYQKGRKSLWTLCSEVFGDSYSKNENEKYYSFGFDGKSSVEMFDYVEYQDAWEKHLFQPEETEQQRKIRELEETIKKAQEQIEQLKEMDK